MLVEGSLWEISRLLGQETFAVAENLAQAVAQLLCGRLGERHHQDVLDAQAVDGDEPQVDILDVVGLARAGAGLDQQAATEVKILIRDFSSEIGHRGLLVREGLRDEKLTRFKNRIRDYMESVLVGERARFAERKPIVGVIAWRRRAVFRLIGRCPLLHRLC